MTFTRWEARLLGALGLDATPARVLFLHAWAQVEGGAARFNPLNTTERVHGSTSYNSAGVQHFPDALSGLAATLLTIRLPYYATLRAALAAPGLTSFDIARRSRLALDTWGTGGLKVEAVIRRTR